MPSPPPPPDPSGWAMRSARIAWDRLTPVCRRALLGERPRGVAGALGVLAREGLLGPDGQQTPAGLQAALWGRTNGDLGWAAWATAPEDRDSLWTTCCLGWEDWRTLLRGHVGLPAAAPTDLVEAGTCPAWHPSSLGLRCTTRLVDLAQGLSDAQRTYLLDCTAEPGAVGWAIHGYHVRVMRTHVDQGLAEERDGCAYYTPLGWAVAQVARGPRAFERKENNVL